MLINQLNEQLGRIVSWTSFLLVLVVCYDVIMRYLFRVSSVGIQELEWHIFAFMFLMAAGYTLKHDKHVRVDVIYQKLSDKNQAIINLVGSIVFLIPFSVLVIWASQSFVAMSFTIGEGSPDPGGLPYRFLLKALIPLGFFFVLLQGISIAVESYIKIKQAGKSSEANHA